jgi:hypothetical protein
MVGSVEICSFVKVPHAAAIPIYSTISWVDRSGNDAINDARVSVRHCLKAGETATKFVIGRDQQQSNALQIGKNALETQVVKAQTLTCQSTLTPSEQSKGT